MADAINPVLRLYSDTYNMEGYSSVHHLSRGLLSDSEMLSPSVTHLYYSSSEFGRKNFPLSFLTEGMNRTRSIGSADLSFQVPIIGRPKRSTTISKALYSVGDKPGINGSRFEIVFAEKLFKANQIVMSPNRNIQIHIKQNARQVGDHFHYQATLVTSSKSNFVPVDLLAIGTKWGRGIVKVGIEDSVGTEHRSYSPGKMQNQLSVVRDTFKIKGNVENKIMVVEIPTDQGVKKYWSEWEYYLRGLDWKETCEADLWYSQYNKDENGEIMTLDELANDSPVPSGAGVLQQITNEDTYSTMTTSKLTQIIRNAFFNNSDSGQRHIEVFTGTGGQEEASNAMQAGAQGFTLVDSHHVQGSGGWDGVFGFYFSTYRHVDGHTVTFRSLPMMDQGIYGEISEKHPISGLPLESYNMYFLDMSTYDGEPNIVYVSEKGREDTTFVVAGAKVPNGYDDTVFRATSRDGSSVEFMKSQGIQIRRPTNCFKVFCELS